VFYEMDRQILDYLNKYTIKSINSTDSISHFGDLQNIEDLRMQYATVKLNMMVNGASAPKKMIN